MKKFMTPVAMGAVVLAIGAFAVADHHLAGEKEHGDKIDFFDVEKCTICKCMGEHKDLMAAVKWETHLLEDGMLMMSVVPKDMQDKMSKCCEEMHATAEKVMTGQVEGQMCGFCQGFGGLMAAGAKHQEIETGVGRITVITSDKAETVKMIHDLGKKAQEATEKMEKEMMQGGAASVN